MSKDIRRILANGEEDQLIRGLSLNDYLGLPAISCSSLLKGRKSLKHLRHHYENSVETTDPMRKGEATDHLLFEHGVKAVREGRPLTDAIDSFRESWPVMNERRAGKNWISKSSGCNLHVEHGVQYLRNDEELEDIVSMVVEVCRDPVAMEHWESGEPQLTLVLTINGLRVKMRPDWVGESIDDLKTTADVSGWAFSRTAFSLRYTDKMAMYRYGIQKLTGHEKPCNLIAVESSGPFDVAVVPIDQATLMLSCEKILDITRAVKDSIDKDEWPGVAKGEPMPLAVPAYEMEEPEWV